MAYRSQKLAESPTLSPPRSLSFASPRGAAGYMKGNQGLSESFVSPGATAKLEHVTERFAALWSDLENEKQSRKLAETSKVQTLQECIGKLEKSLEVEVKRRIDSDKQLQLHFESEVNRIETRLGAQISDLQTSLKSLENTLSGRIQELFGVIREEREQRRGDTEHLANTLVGKVNECIQALDEERNVRIMEQASTLKRSGEDLYTLQSKLEQERITRENDLGHLRSEIHEALGNRNTADDQFKAMMMDEVAKLSTSVQMEREERIAEDDEIVQAINDYTKALQDGLKIVNS